MNGRILVSFVYQTVGSNDEMVLGQMQFEDISEMHSWHKCSPNMYGNKFEVIQISIPIDFER